MPNIPIDWADVNWVYVVLLALFVFVSTAVGNLLSFGERGIAAVLSALIFGVIFVFWSYYPHHVPLLPTTLRVEKPAVIAPAAPVAPAGPVRPRNPVTTISPPPANPPPPPVGPPKPQ
jgi:hypothetical protein